jgi:hypothetical protein
LILASYAATAIAFLLIGYAIGRRRDAKVRNEISRVGAMVIAEMTTSVRHRGASVEQAEHANASVSASYDVDQNVATAQRRS